MKLTNSKNEESTAHHIRNTDYCPSTFFMHVFTYFLFCFEYRVKIYCNLYYTIFYIQVFLLTAILQKQKWQKLARFFPFQTDDFTNLHKLGVFQKILNLAVKNTLKVNGCLDQKRYYIEEVGKST